MSTYTVTVVGDEGSAARRELERCVGEGGVVLFGADTLYGLGCDPDNAEAIARIHEIKSREQGKPSAVMFFNRLALHDVVAGSGPRTKEAIDALLPGPVTLVVDNSQHCLFPLACGDDRSRLGLRLIEGPLAGTDVALFQTSANTSGEDPPARFGEVHPEILTAADLAIDCGELSGEPSTVVDISTIEDDPGSWTILREGAVPRSAIQLALGPPE